MALHCVWTTSSFTEAMLKCANTRGDSDSVCSVAGQIAGAVYGLKNIPRDWVQAVLKWDKYCYIPLRAYKLYKRHSVEGEPMVVVGCGGDVVDKDKSSVRGSVNGDVPNYNI